jgi:hypothetical protein
VEERAVIVPPDGLQEITEIFGPPIQSTDDWRIKRLDITPWYPEGIPFSWMPNVREKSVECHTLVSAPLTAVFDMLQERELLYMIRTWGGCHSYRNKKGKAEWSTHSWGIAVDVNPGSNEYGAYGDMPYRVVEAFRTHGWLWLGENAIPDPMHFQYCRGY